MDFKFKETFFDAAAAIWWDFGLGLSWNSTAKQIKIFPLLLFVVFYLKISLQFASYTFSSFSQAHLARSKYVVWIMSDSWRRWETNGKVKVKLFKRYIFPYWDLETWHQLIVMSSCSRRATVLSYFKRSNCRRWVPFSIVAARYDDIKHTRISIDLQFNCINDSRSVTIRLVILVIRYRRDYGFGINRFYIMSSDFVIYDSL